MQLRCAFRPSRLSACSRAAVPSSTPRTEPSCDLPPRRRRVRASALASLQEHFQLRSLQRIQWRTAAHEEALWNRRHSLRRRTIPLTPPPSTLSASRSRITWEHPRVLPRHGYPRVRPVIAAQLTAASSPAELPLKALASLPRPPSPTSPTPMASPPESSSRPRTIPGEDNGIKIFGSDGYKLPDATELAIEEEIFKHLASSPNTEANTTQMGAPSVAHDDESRRETRRVRRMHPPSTKPTAPTTSAS